MTIVQRVSNGGESTSESERTCNDRVRKLLFVLFLLTFSGKIQELLQQIEAGDRVDPEAEEVSSLSFPSLTHKKLLIRLSEEFLDAVIESSTRLAKHRGAATVEAKDVLMELGVSASCISRNGLRCR